MYEYSYLLTIIDYLRASCLRLSSLDNDT